MELTPSCNILLRWILKLAVNKISSIRALEVKRAAPKTLMILDIAVKIYIWKFWINAEGVPENFHTKWNMIFRSEFSVCVCLCVAVVKRCIFDQT